MKSQTGIALVIRAFMPVGRSIDDQYAALTMVKEAHQSGDYTALLKAATIEEVKAEQKTRRVNAQGQTEPGDGQDGADGQDGGGDQADGQQTPSDPPPADAAPAPKGRKAAA